jgi:hypothetical protein
MRERFATGLLFLLAACRHPAGAAARPDASCGAFECAQYDSPIEAFRAAIGGDVRVVSIGEAHAPKGARAPSSAKRFTETILSSLAGRASDLVVELMLPPSGCRAEVALAKKAEEPVTTRHASADPSEYVAMGEAARKLGVVPDLLRPSCADLAAIDASDDPIEASLRTIERLTREKVVALLDRNARTPGDAGKIVVTYGGAIHNDRAPPPERLAWSFGPALDQATGGRYVEVDLFVPEFMDGSDVWKSRPFYAAYDPARLGRKTTMFRLRERSYVIVFPLVEPAAAEPSPGEPKVGDSGSPP